MKSKILFLFVCFVSIKLNAQEIDSRIVEVYGDKTTELVTNDNARLKDLNDILFNRCKVVEMPVVGVDKYPRLSAIPLLNKYNSNLSRDKVFNPENFNPLKYQLNFFPKSSAAIYRIDGTDYVIVIEPQIIKH